jgi:hypothetical protein
LFEAARCIQNYGWAVATNADAAERMFLKQAAETVIASIQHWPKGGLQAVKESLAKAAVMPDIGAELRERKLRLLCVRREIQCDAPTPIEDEALRREYQVQRLMQGIGQGRHADVGHWDAMILEWVRSDAISPAVYENLQRRFLDCWEKRLVGDSQQP